MYMYIPRSAMQLLFCVRDGCHDQQEDLPPGPSNLTSPCPRTIHTSKGNNHSGGSGYFRKIEVGVPHFILYPSIRAFRGRHREKRICLPEDYSESRPNPKEDAILSMTVRLRNSRNVCQRHQFLILTPLYSLSPTRIQVSRYMYITSLSFTWFG